MIRQQDVKIHIHSRYFGREVALQSLENVLQGEHDQNLADSVRQSVLAELEHAERFDPGRILIPAEPAIMAPAYPAVYNLRFESAPNVLNNYLSSKLWHDLYEVLRCMRNVCTGFEEIGPYELLFGFAAFNAHDRKSLRPRALFALVGDRITAHDIEVPDIERKRAFEDLLFKIGDRRIFVPKKWIRRLFGVLRSLPGIRQAEWRKRKDRSALEGFHVDVGAKDTDPQWKMIKHNFSPPHDPFPGVMEYVS